MEREDEELPPPSFLLSAAFYVFFSSLYWVVLFYVCPLFLPLSLFSSRDSFYAIFTFLDILLLIFRPRLPLV